jgi:probable O-glycosylation ligase (exosortase A-associated)
MSGARDFIFLVVLAGLVPVSFARPWVGVLAWSWIAYMAPHRLTWGFAQSLPVAMLIGGAVLAGLVFTRDRQRIPWTATTLLLAAFSIHITVTTVVGYMPALSWGKWDWVSKSLAMTFVTLMLFQDRVRLRYLYMVMALSLGFYGLKGGIWVLRTGGDNRVWGPEGTFFGDNNTLGLALCMALPLLLYLSREEARPWLKWLLRVVFAGSCVAILFTYSRGAFLGLAVVMAVLIWRSPWRLRFGAAVLVVALLGAPLVPADLANRIRSIALQEEAETRDTSSTGRLEAWATAWNIAAARPLTGGGFRVLWNDSVWQTYHEGAFLEARDAHSLYFEVLGEHGFVGLGLYLAIVGITLVNLGRIRRRWRGHAEHGYLSRYAEMTQLSLYPFLVAGAFLGVAYFDLYFHLVSTSIILQRLSSQAESIVAPAPVSTLGRLPARRPRDISSIPARSTKPRTRHA